MISKDDSLKQIRDLKKSLPDFTTSKRKEVGAWYAKALITIEHLFGIASRQYSKLDETKPDLVYWDNQYMYGEEEKIRIMEETAILLDTYIYEIGNFSGSEASKIEIDKTNLIRTKKVFIVHGHDKGKLEAVARFLEKLSLEPIILHEQPNAGDTVIEKFIKHSQVNFAIVLLTPDDAGAKTSEADKLKPRARQNVIFELGYFIAKLGRDRVCALLVEDVEIPTDYFGVLYIKFDGEEWKFKLAKELKSSGYDVDMNLIV